MAEARANLETFRKISAILTGYDGVDLDGTGNVECLCRALQEALGNNQFDGYLKHVAGIVSKSGSAAERDEAIRLHLAEDEHYGPITQRLMKLWYGGTWLPLSKNWIEAYGAVANNERRVISAEAYTESLVWDAIGAHPMAAKPPGFATWGHPPPAAYDKT